MGVNADLFLRKGCYPYEYIDSFVKFDETKLPPKEAFYSSLMEEDVSDGEYAHANNIWSQLNIQTSGRVP